jgi:hypothetical protein
MTFNSPTRGEFAMLNEFTTEGRQTMCERKAASTKGREQIDKSVEASARSLACGPLIIRSRSNRTRCQEVTMIDNRASICNSTDTIADFVTDSVAFIRELEIREIAPEKVVGILPVITPNVDSLTRQPQFRVLYRTSQAVISVQTTAH